MRVRLARVFAELPVPQAVECLLDAIEDPDSDVRYHILKALNRLRRNHAELSFRVEPVERALRRKLGLLADLSGARATTRSVEASEGVNLLALVIGEREDDAVERITRCLGLVYGLDEVFHAYRAIATDRPDALAQGIELLDTVLRPVHRRAVIPLLERLDGVSSQPVPPSSAAWRSADPWLAACLSFVERKRTRAPETLLSIEDRTMMTIVERVDFLREVDMFSRVRTEYLAKIAVVAKERALADLRHGNGV